MLADKIRSATAGEKLYVDDVFSAYLYDGNGSTQTINNGIDLAGKGGLVWIKGRAFLVSHHLHDTIRGANQGLYTDSTVANQNFNANPTVTGFTSTGFTLGANSGVNAAPASAGIYASWTFRKAPKFFDVVTYTGNGVAGRTIPHSLGVAPGMMFVKRTNRTGNWTVYHRSTGASQSLQLNSTEQASADTNSWNATQPTNTDFTVGGNTNVDTDTYVAYLFAHDTATDGMIQCGVTTGASTVTLGWEPQFVLMKSTTAVDGWRIMDATRGLIVSANSPTLRAEATTAESPASTGVWPEPTGFYTTTVNASIYIAIRRPNKPPTSGTQVFNPTVYTGTNVDNRLINTGILTDMVWLRQRNGSGAGYEGFVVGDRLRGQPWLKTGATQAEQTVADGLDQQLVSSVEYGTAFSSMTGVWVGNNSGAATTATNVNANTTSNNHVALAFKRAPGFFDMVAYTGTGANRTVAHNLGDVPELVIFVNRQNTFQWEAHYEFLSTSSRFLYLNTTAAGVQVSYPNRMYADPDATQLYVANSAFTNSNGVSYIAYLFASLPGISKVGTFTLAGSNVNVDCGFTTGARFVLVKRTDSTGDWFVVDSARGIVSSGVEPMLKANGTSPEITANLVEPFASGFTALTAGFGSTGTYIYLAIA